MKILKGILSTLLAIIVIPIITVFILYLSTKYIVSKQGIKDLFRSVTISSFLVDKDGEYNEFGSDIKQELVENGIPEDVIDDFVNSEQISDFFSEYIGGAAGYILYDDPLDNIKAEDISKLINDNVDDIVKEIRDNKVEGYEELTDERVEQFKSEVDNISKEIENSIPDLKKEIDDSDVSDAFKVVRMLFSKTMLYAFIVVIAIFLLLITLLNLKNFKFCNWIGAIFILASTPVLLLNVAASVINVNTDYKGIAEIIDFLFSKTSFYAFLFFIVGILLIVFAIIMRVISKKRKNKNNGGMPVEPVQPAVSENKVVGYDPNTGFPIYEGTEQASTIPVSTEPKITGYDPNTGFPIYEGGNQTPEVKEEVVTEEPKEEVVTPEVKEEVAPVEPTIAEATPVNEEAPAEESICAGCGAKLNAGQNFCYNCGTSKK